MGNTVNKKTVVTNENVKVKTIIPQKKYNILILGLNGSGKTTLLYHNFIPEWTNITSYMGPPISYHYGEIKWINGRLGFWDLSGNPLMRNICSLIYRNYLTLLMRYTNIQENLKNDMLIKYKIEDLINHYGNRIHYLFVDCKNCKMDKGWIQLMQQISYYF
ncbi:ADP-ribosylation factor [Plasmodium falciparum RAJ116]|uniref:ADP-ribosylation factor n=1 Tax=Plasmodium falciparum RAJ116 TaxID=580058 RepID=A0A0L0CV52_PLAFA|nr:ADP-ribosylation factor [Plasmodium falciparum RAJ116]